MRGGWKEKRAKSRCEEHIATILVRQPYLEEFYLKTSAKFLRSS